MEEDEEEMNLDTLGEEGSQIKKDKLLEDIEEGNLEEATDGAGGYSISKDVAGDEIDNEESETIDETNEFPESVFESESPPPEPPVPLDSDGSEDIRNPPEKKISLSIEKLRKMVDEQDK